MENLEKVDRAIDSANRRLRKGELGITVQRLGASLYLQGTLPPRLGASRSDYHQQRIALRLKANPANVGMAERESRVVSGKLAAREFSWEVYQRQRREPKPETVGDWVEKFTRVVEPTVSAGTWRSDYRQVFRKLTLDAPLTEQILVKAIATTAENSKQRKRVCIALNRLARFAGLESSIFAELKGNYSELHTAPRNLPDDRLVAECFYKITDPGWRWVYGAIATFGLRNHEAFYLDISALLDGDEWVEVLEGKTGNREVWAYYPEWVEQFDLKNRVLPRVTGKSHEDYGRRVSRFFEREIPFNCYNLRHCWAVRTIEFGLDVTLAARQMGHSVAVHEHTYHRWIKKSTHERTHQRLKANPHRPLPPS